MKKSTFASLCLLGALSLTLYSCKDTQGPYVNPLQAKIMTYMCRVIDIDVSKTDKVHVPVKAIFVNDVALARERNGLVLLDSTTAIENVHFAFPETESGTSMTDTTFTFPIKLYPSRITEPMTITLVTKEFLYGSLPDRQSEVIDTITINLIPAR